MIYIEKVMSGYELRGYLRILYHASELDLLFEDFIRII
jgi:hypothetical protein